MLAHTVREQCGRSRRCSVSSMSSPSSKRSPSLRHLVDRSAVALVILGALVVSALFWLAFSVRATTADLSDGYAGRMVANTAATELLNYHRLANTDVVVDDPGVDSGRAVAEHTIRDQLAVAAELASPGFEADLVEAAMVAVDEYLETREALEARNLPVDAVIEAARPTLGQAYRRLDQLRRLNQDQVIEAELASAREVQLAQATAAMLGFVVVLALLSSVLGVRQWLLTPVLRLRESIERYGEGEDTPADEGGPRELAEIAHAFNEMSRTLARRRHKQLAYLGGVAHDIRNPLGVLELGLEMLGDISTNPRVEATVARLRRQLEQLARLAGDLTAAARLQAENLEIQARTFDLREAARQVVELYRPSSQIHHLELNLPRAPVWVHADRDRIEQVLVNLLTNAIKYSPAGGQISVTLRPGPERVELEVTDEGVGIPAEELADVFEPFQRRDDSAEVGGPGSGLGLWIVFRILQSHGGGIEVHSQPGKGSTFRAWLPRTGLVESAP